MRIRAFKYLSPLIVYMLTVISFSQTGWLTFLPVIYAFGAIPLIELWQSPDPKNLDTASEEMIRRDPVYDYILYCFVLLQYGALAYFLFSISELQNDLLSMAGRVATMGLLCGSFGINIGHELGHRSTRFEQFLAKASLLTSLYMHFFIEHNKGHHKRVATYDDPGTARRGESVYFFWVRAILVCYRNAWKIAGREAAHKGRAVISWSNEMLRMQVVQLVFSAAIALLFGFFALCCFLVASVIGILMLETVNYIEHYGLQRKSLGDGKYERPLPVHSWNSDHIMGRLMLFELSRHSDHHFQASRKYQVLRHHEEAPQMPTGYPGMMLLSLLPPVWFRIMHDRIQQLTPSRSSG